MTVTIGPVSTRIAAPPPLVYQLISAIGQGVAPDGERTDVIQRNGDELVCDFWTTVSLPLVADRIVRTRERVTLRPPDTIDFEHLDGPVRGLKETITVSADPGGGSRIAYVGTYEPRGIVHHLLAGLLARPVIRRIVREHFDDIRSRAEARAARSRVFPEEASAGQPL